jgi:hypothetical protein
VISLKKTIIGIIAVLCMVAVSAVPALALDDDEFSGISANTLTISVGYFGGPYYEKAFFSLDDLWAMDIVYDDYTFIDNMPSVVISHVAGVRLSDIVTAAGIDVGSVRTFYFWTNDKAGDYYTSFSKTELIDTPRYRYYSLPDNWDYDLGEANEYAGTDSARVDTLIALADDWTRTIAGATFGSDYQNLNTNTRFRLVFGQTNTWEHTASRSAKWIHEIKVELGGSPSLKLDASALEGEVGSVLRTEAFTNADSAVMKYERVQWSSSDESVAVVDENGNITILADGTAEITASLLGVTASLIVSGKGSPDSGAGAGSGEGTGEGPQAGPDELHQLRPRPEHPIQDLVAPGPVLQAQSLFHPRGALRDIAEDVDAVQLRSGESARCARLHRQEGQQQRGSQEDRGDSFFHTQHTQLPFE